LKEEEERGVNFWVKRVNLMDTERKLNIIDEIELKIK